jgi:hypothetical protein
MDLGDPFADTITPVLLRLLPSHVTEVEIKLHVTPRGQDITYSALNRALANRSMIGTDITQEIANNAIAAAVMLVLPESEHDTDFDFVLELLVQEGEKLVDYGLKGSASWKTSAPSRRRRRRRAR